MLYHYVADYWEFQRTVGEMGSLYRPQAPVKYQLLTLLFVLGCSGTDSNYKKIGSRFGISHGLVQIFVDRCTRAVLSELRNDAIVWPDADGRKYISRRIQEKYGFPNCIGMLDGTVLPLAFKPTLYGEEYWYRKGGYAVHCLIICDDETRIMDFLVGWPGSVHDNRVWSNADQLQNFQRYFSRLQYLLADSAFTTSAHIISALKCMRGVHVLPKEHELFNTLLAKARIKVEHCIGLLKNRFQCLRGLRTVIKDEESMRRIIDRVSVCITLHNLLVGSSYPQEWEHGHEEDLIAEEIEYEYEEQFVARAEPINAGTNRRDEMLAYMMEWNNAQ